MEDHLASGSGAGWCSTVLEVQNHTWLAELGDAAHSNRHIVFTLLLFKEMQYCKIFESTAVVVLAHHVHQFWQ